MARPVKWDDMKGFVPTPPEVVDYMVDLLFCGSPPKPSSRLLDPGSGTGAFIDGVLRWCSRTGFPVPRITAIESDPAHIQFLNKAYSGNPCIDVQGTDFLLSQTEKYDYIIGNPPYVSITGLSESEKSEYKALFRTARGRFDLYLLFFERALNSLVHQGRLVFITPEKFTYVESASPLRELLASFRIEQIRLMPEDTFGDLVTYPTVTTVSRGRPGVTRVVHRDGRRSKVRVPQDGRSWLHAFSGGKESEGGLSLGDVCLRISCGVATGADKVFVFDKRKLGNTLLPYARPTVGGRELEAGSIDVPRNHLMLMPYDSSGKLLPLDQLGEFKNYLSRDDIRSKLLSRTCAKRKPWHSFHETPVLRDILRPKILFKDICPTPQFWVDWSGDIVPRHSVYYLVPRSLESLPILLDYLCSPLACQWMQENCQRAAKGYVRLQSQVLKRMPIPEEVVEKLNRVSNEPLLSLVPKPKQLGLLRAAS